MTAKIKSYPVSFRIPVDKYAKYLAEARLRKLSLGVYLKQKLEGDEEMADTSPNLNGTKIDELLQLMQQIKSDARDRSKYDDRDINQYRGIMLEMLLLFRSTNQKHKTDMVQAEVRRQGLGVWNPSYWNKDGTYE